MLFLVKKNIEKLCIRDLIIYEILLLNLLKYIFTSEVTWNYEKCSKYINNLDIICIKINKDDNGVIYCDDWEINNISILFIIPDECFNKVYNLDLLVENYNILEKINFNLYINKEKIIKYKNEELKLFKNKKEDIKQCLKIFNEYEKEREFILDEKKNEIIKFNKKINISVFCYSLVPDLISFLENNVKMIKNINNNKNNKSEIIDYYLNNIKIENIENIMKYIYEYNNNEDKSYFPKANRYNENGYIKKFDDYDNELEDYYLKSQKDCVEYGLKSLKEDIVICTKYE